MLEGGLNRALATLNQQAKRLKEERRMLCTELGISDEPDGATAAAAGAAAAAEAVVARPAADGAPAAAAAARPVFSKALKCFGFVFTLNVAPASGPAPSG